MDSTLLTMRESTFTSKIHSLLPKHIHAWKISDRFHAGVPDAWYSGPAGDAWIEYKFYQALPKRFTPRLSPAQKQWLRERYHEGRRVLVIVGDPKYAVLLQHLEWEQPITASARLLSHKATAEWIASTLTDPSST